MKEEIIEINNFKKVFNEIRNMGYVRAINNNNSGIGLTFESLFGKEVDSFPLPDFQNTIEIKTKLAFSTKPVHLFTLTPDGNDFIEVKRLYENYGYYSKNKDSKVFNGTINANKPQKIGLNYYFSLKVNYKEEKIILLVYDCNKQLIDNTTYWTFVKLENALLRKLKYLALIQVWSTQKNGIKYYKYFKYNIYKYSNFYNFLNLVDKGIIYINFSIDTYKDEKRYGQIHDHGTTFNISKNDLKQLFFQIY